MWKVASVGGGADARDFSRRNVCSRSAHTRPPPRSKTSLTNLPKRLELWLRTVAALPSASSTISAVSWWLAPSVEPAAPPIRRTRYAITCAMLYVFPAPDSPLTITAWFVRARSSPRYAASATE